MLYEQSLQEFKRYVNFQKTRINDDKILDLIKMKYIHSLEVVKDGYYVSQELNFSDSFIDLVKICCLDHDIGRFEQAILLGNFSDYDLKQKIGLNHGELGFNILRQDLLKKQIPIRLFDFAIATVVKNHVDINVSYKDLLILQKNILQSEDASYFFRYASLKEQNKVINLVTQIIQDVDRLDIYHQILDGRYVPKKSNDKVDDEILKLFYQGKYLDINEIKKQGLWNSNVGELVRLSFINQIKLLSVAKLIKQENMILRMKKLRDNGIISDAFDYSNYLLERMIEESDDKILVKRFNY